MQLNLTILGEGRCLPAYVGRPAPSRAAVVCFPSDECALAGGRARMWRRRALDRRRLAAGLARATDRLRTGPRGPRRRRPQLGSPRWPLAQPRCRLDANRRTPPLYMVERGPGDGPKPHHTWHYPCGFGPSAGEVCPPPNPGRVSPPADRSPRRRVAPARPPSDAPRPGRWPPARPLA